MGYGVGWHGGGVGWSQAPAERRVVKRVEEEREVGAVQEARAVREAAPEYEIPGAGPCSGDRDPLAHPDLVDDLGDEIAILSAHIESATQRLLVLIARFDELRGWERAGHRSCAHWLAHRTGIDGGAARERVRAARALAELPLIRAALARGELTFSKVRALTRVATADNEAHLLEFAGPATAAQLERFVRGWKMGNSKMEEERDDLRHAARCLSVFPDLDGSYVVKGRLTPEVGALLMRAIEAASDVLYRQELAEREERMKAGDTEAAAARRRADALALLAERALGVGFGGGDAGKPGNAGVSNGSCVGRGLHGSLRKSLRVSAETCGASGTLCDEPGRAANDSAAPISGTRAQRYQVLVHVDLETLQGEDSGKSSHVEDVRVSAETSRRITCDAALVVVQAGSSQPLNLGRRTRTISPSLRRALEVRDRGCRFPGCGSRFTDAHHIRHWALGGETSLGNCILLCRHHHRLVHEGGWSVGLWGAGRPVFHDPRGGTHFDGRWTPPKLGSEPVASLLADNFRWLRGETDQLEQESRSYEMKS